MTMITPSYLGETIEYSSLHACRSTLEDPTPSVSLRTGFQALKCGCDLRKRGPRRSNFRLLSGSAFDSFEFFGGREIRTRGPASQNVSGLLPKVCDD